MFEVFLIEFFVNMLILGLLFCEDCEAFLSAKAGDIWLLIPTNQIFRGVYHFDTLFAWIQLFEPFSLRCRCEAVFLIVVLPSGSLIIPMSSFGSVNHRREYLLRELLQLDLVIAIRRERGCVSGIIRFRTHTLFVYERSISNPVLEHQAAKYSTPAANSGWSFSPGTFTNVPLL